MPSGAVTFLFSDVVGSTRLWAQSPQGMSSALRLHDELMRRNITEHGGYIFSAAGDSFAAAFEDANAATSCAAAVSMPSVGRNGDRCRHYWFASDSIGAKPSSGTTTTTVRPSTRPPASCRSRMVANAF